MQSAQTGAELVQSAQAGAELAESAQAGAELAGLAHARAELEELHLHRRIGLLVPAGLAQRLQVLLAGHCPGRETQKQDVKPCAPYKTVTERRFTMKSAKAFNAPGRSGRCPS